MKGRRTKWRLFNSYATALRDVLVQEVVLPLLRAVTAHLLHTPGDMTQKVTHEVVERIDSSCTCSEPGIVSVGHDADRSAEVSRKRVLEPHEIAIPAHPRCVGMSGETGNRDDTANS